MWFSVVYTLIDNNTRHHSGQNVVDPRGAAEWSYNKLWMKRFEWSTTVLLPLPQKTFNFIIFYFLKRYLLSFNWLPLNVYHKTWFYVTYLCKDTRKYQVIDVLSEKLNGHFRYFTILLNLKWTKTNVKHQSRVWQLSC